MQAEFMSLQLIGSCLPVGCILAINIKARLLSTYVILNHRPAANTSLILDEILLDLQGSDWTLSLM